MIHLKENTLDRISNWTDDSIHILADFDRTITIGSSQTSWGILAKYNLVSQEYTDERNALYDHYRPIEIDETLDYKTKSKLMIEWWKKHIDLFLKYKLSETVINEATRNLQIMAFRNGAKEFLMDMKNRNIPVIIISAGVGNFIEQFLIKNDCNFDNIYIISNFIKFENGIATGVSNNVIHSLNKNEVSLPEEIKDLIINRPNIILLGDSISDINMASEKDRDNALKIGFLEEKVDENMGYFKEQFDIVCTNEVTYIDLYNRIDILR